MPWTEKIDQVKPHFELCKNVLDRVLKTLDETNLYDKYDSVFNQQLTDGILEEISISEMNIDEHVFIPHRHILKSDEQVTTKLRVVLNCSLKTKDSPSLNEFCYPGTNLLNDLLGFLLKIRADPYLVMSDIRQAFLMIRLSKISDRNKFTVLWRNKEGHLKAYRYTTIPFGYASSPFILHYVIKHHIKMFKQDC